MFVQLTAQSQTKYLYIYKSDQQQQQKWTNLRSLQWQQRMQIYTLKKYEIKFT